MISSLELARLCGVSQGTVDRALHGRLGIAGKTREKILEAARRHGYAPNPVARELMTGQSKCCGAVMPAGGGVFFLDLFEELRKALRRRGLTLFIAPAANAEECADALREMAARRLRGLALVPPSDNFKIPEEVAGACPVASLASPCEGARYIAPDEVRTGFDGAKFLWSLGHRRIAFLTYKRDARAIRERRAGYEKFMRSKGEKPATLIQPEDEDVLKLFKSGGATAFFCHNEWLALNCQRAFERAGVKVPDEASLLGVDSSPTFTALFPGLSAMAYPYAAAAEAAAAIMTGETTRVPKLPALEVEERSSTSRKR